MSDYENNTKEELIELLKCKDEEIERLEQAKNSIEEEYSDYEYNAQETIDSSFSLTEQESLAEKSFYSGYKSGVNSKETAMKSWLNYRMEARL